MRDDRRDLEELIRIARAITAEHDLDALLGIILEKSRAITGADAGSIYVVEEGQTGPVLRFKLTQNDSVAFTAHEFTFPVSKGSIAGSVALNQKMLNLADVYGLPPEHPFDFDRTVDNAIGYRTRSMLVAPLVSQRRETIGVIQLINRKNNFDAKLTSPESIDTEVIPFDERSEQLVGMLGAQAAASLETALLYDEIQGIFGGFVRASVEAIESRDPTTSGHSRRVAGLTVALAETVASETRGPYGNLIFSAQDLRELEYASLLHDFGKIGVREKVLVKAKKLYPEDLERVRMRLALAARSIEVDILQKKLYAREMGTSEGEYFSNLDEEARLQRAHLEEAWVLITSANEPTVMEEGEFTKIEALAQETYLDPDNQVQPLITAAEVAALSIKRGSLSTVEFDEIRSHVTHTARYLSQIPWGKAFRRIPLIAGAHHEWLNGKGYPKRLCGDEIPVQARMMAIADVFDALTASDRPYKKAVPLERALSILDTSVTEGQLDGELVRLFHEAQVWTRA